MQSPHVPEARILCRYGFDSVRLSTILTFGRPLNQNKDCKTMSRSTRYLQLAAAGSFFLHLTPALSFTAEQAAAGRMAYEQSCVMCHGTDLRLLPIAPLAGPEFVGKRQTRSINELIAQVRATMPPEGGAG